jgi:hypothetical protein
VRTERDDERPVNRTQARDALATVLVQFHRRRREAA